MTLAAWSYAIAAVAFLGTAWLLPRRWMPAWLASGAWAAALAAAGGRLPAVVLWLPMLELLRYTALLLIFGSLMGWGNRGLRVVTRIGWLAAAMLCVAGPFLMSPDRVLSRVGLILAFLGLVQIEQVLRRAAPAAASSLKLCVLGVGGNFAYDLFLFSQSELLGEVEYETWALRGLVVTAFIPFAVVGARRLADERSRLFVSRQVVFYTTAFMSVGIYLSLMALGGYYVREHGGRWGDMLRMAFFAGAGIVLSVLLLSNSPWRRLRVFLTKHFYRNKYDYRVEWLRFISTLSGGELAGDTRVRAICAVAQIFESPGGVLYLLADGGSRFEAVASSVNGDPLPGLPAPLPVEHDLARFLAERQWVVDVREYMRSPDVYRNIDLPDWLMEAEPAWRMVSPLLEQDQMIGFIALQQPEGGFQMTFEDRDLLRTVGRHVATLIAQQNAERKLTESRQFDAFNRFAAFVMHDLKNSVAQLQLLVNNAARHRHNPEFMDDAIETIGNTAARMTRLIEQLQSRDTLGSVKPVLLGPLLEAVGQRASARMPLVNVRCEEYGACVEADVERLSAVIDHAVRNAQEAAGKGGHVDLSLRRLADFAEVSVRDDGPGMEESFVRDRLFRPFDSTKGSKGMGVGAYQIREYVRQLGGAVEVQSSPGRGTNFLIRLPLCQISANPAS